MSALAVGFANGAAAQGWVATSVPPFAPDGHRLRRQRLGPEMVGYQALNATEFAGFSWTPGGGVGRCRYAWRHVYARTGRQQLGSGRWLGKQSDHRRSYLGVYRGTGRGIVNLGTQISAIASVANGVSGNGQVVGWRQPSGGNSQAFMWSQSAPLKVLAISARTRSTRSVVLGINSDDGNWVVGEAQIGNFGSSNHAFVWTLAGGMVDSSERWAVRRVERRQ